MRRKRDGTGEINRAIGRSLLGRNAQSGSYHSPAGASTYRSTSKYATLNDSRPASVASTSSSSMDMDSWRQQVVAPPRSPTPPPPPPSKKIGAHLPPIDRLATMQTATSGSAAAAGSSSAGAHQPWLRDRSLLVPPDDPLGVLLEHRLFATIRHSDVSALVSRRVIDTFRLAANTSLEAEGKPAASSHVLILLAGVVTMSRGGRDLGSLYGAGTTLLEEACRPGAAPYRSLVTLKTETAVTAWGIPRDTYQRLLTMEQVACRDAMRAARLPVISAVRR